MSERASATSFVESLGDEWEPIRDIFESADLIMGAEPGTMLLQFLRDFGSIASSGVYMKFSALDLGLADEQVVDLIGKYQRDFPQMLDEVKRHRDRLNIIIEEEERA